tara:strand:+ start:146 stop:1948 length:1803 start_codon:yes stop_codon:yes gene_type:complete
MSSEHLASAQNQLKGNLGGAWDMLSGAQGQYQDLGIARRFGGSVAAFSLRDIGAINGRVVKVRRSGDDLEEDFSANQVQSGTLQSWVNGGLENTLPGDVSAAAAAFSLRKVKSAYSGFALRVQLVADGSEFDVSFDANDKVSTSSLVTRISGSHNVSTIGELLNVVDPGGDSLTVAIWYDQSGNGNNAVQASSTDQPRIATDGALLADGLQFDGSNNFLQTTSQVLTGTETGSNSMYAVIKQTSGDAGYVCGSAANPSGGNQIGQSLYADGATSNKIVLTNGNDANTSTGDNIPTVEGSNFLISSNYSNNNANTLHSNSLATSYANGSSAYDFNAGDRFTIAARKDSTSAAAVLFNGSMKEIIAYDSAQTLNRFKIESNINNYYSLYTSGEGFVPTWYDQSTNGNNATQTTEDNQPKIVTSGATIKNSKGNPSIEFDGINDHLTYGNVITNINTASSFIYLERGGTSGNEIVTHQGSNTTSPASRWYTPYLSGTTAYLGYGNTGTTALSLGTVSASSPTLLSFACGSSNVEAFANGTSKGTLSLEDAATGSITSSAIGTFGPGTGLEYTGKVTEYFITASKLQDDADGINAEINNHYNIY